VLAMAETFEEALVVGFEHEFLQARLAVFDGAMDEADTEHHDHLASAALGVDLTFLDEALVLGASFITDLADTLGGAGPDGKFGFAPSARYGRDVPGGGVYLGATLFDRVALRLEAVGALGRFSDRELDADLDGHGDRPWAFNTELTVVILPELLSATARLEGSGEWSGAPALQTGLSVTATPWKYASFGAEALYGSYDSDLGGGLRETFLALAFAKVSF